MAIIRPKKKLWLPRKPGVRGFSLLEAILTLALFGALLAVIAGQLRLYATDYAQTYTQIRQNSALWLWDTRLRRFAQAATNIDLPYGDTLLRLELSGQSIEYSCANAKLRERLGAAVSYLSRPASVAAVAFVKTGPLLSYQITWADQTISTGAVTCRVLL